MNAVLNSRLKRDKITVEVSLLRGHKSWRFHVLVCMGFPRNVEF